MFLLVLLLSAVMVQSQPEGWRMVDRFFGFRYELSTADQVDTAAFLSKVQSEADAYACFGWVQKNPVKNTFVGEARCSKARGPVFLDKLKTLAEVNQAEVLVSFLNLTPLFIFVVVVMIISYAIFHACD